jgi:hypothetical protein
MADLLDLALFTDQLANKLGGAASAVAKDVATTVLTDLIQVTPVDTATALSNWRVTLNTPASGVIPAYNPSPRGRIKDGVWVHTVDPVLTAQANAQPTFDAGDSVIKSKQPGQDIFITNNVPYVPELDRGSSTQSPAGFVDRAVILGDAVRNRAVII